MSFKRPRARAQARRIGLLWRRRRAFAYAEQEVHCQRARPVRPSHRTRSAAGRGAHRRRSCTSHAVRAARVAFSTKAPTGGGAGRHVHPAAKNRLVLARYAGRSAQAAEIQPGPFELAPMHVHGSAPACRIQRAAPAIFGVLFGDQAGSTAARRARWLDATVWWLWLSAM